jgi:hypothetical protein
MAEQMRALSIRQPWTDAIVLGTKRVENRGWPAPAWILGRVIALHASKVADRGAQPPPGEEWPSGLTDSSRLGAVLAVARVRDCHFTTGGLCGCSPWAVPGQFHWTLADVRLLPDPVPCKGALGLWRLPEDVEAAVRAQLDSKEDARG